MDSERRQALADEYMHEIRVNGRESERAKELRAELLKLGYSERDLEWFEFT